MSLFFTGLAIYFFYRVAKWIISGGINLFWKGGLTSLSFKWREIRSKDLFQTLCVILLIVAFEWLFPSMSLTGLERPERHNPGFLASSIDFPEGEFTYAKLGENSILLGNFALSDEDVLLNKIEQLTGLILKITVELEMKNARREVLRGKLKLLNGQETLKDSIEQNKLERQLIRLNSRINRSARMLVDEESSLEDLQNELHALKAKASSADADSEIDKIFPKLDGQIELFSDYEFGRPKSDQIVYGPKSVLSARTGNQFLKAVQGKIRHHYNPRRKIACFLVISEVEGAPSANRMCEVIIPLPIDYDLTHDECGKEYTNIPEYSLEFPLNQKVTLISHCIERWKFPFLKIQYTQDEVIVFEPSVHSNVEGHVFENGSPISQWEVEFRNIKRPLNGKAIFPRDRSAANFDKIRLYHVPRSNKNLANSERVGGARIWRDFYLDKVRRDESLLIVNPLFLPRHQFEETEVSVKIEYKYISQIDQFLIDSTDSEAEQKKLGIFAKHNQSRLHKQLKQKLEDFEIIAFSKLENGSLAKSNTNSPVKCNISDSVIEYLDIQEDNSVRLKIIEKKRPNVAALSKLVTSDDGAQIYCEKFNAVKRLLGEVIDYYDTDINSLGSAITNNFKY